VELAVELVYEVFVEGFMELVDYGFVELFVV
jgi:hypothetical protein